MSEAANAAVIECIIKRPGGSEVEMADGTIYRFQPNLQSQHVALVENMDHVATFIGIKEAYRVVNFLAASVAPPPAAVSVGAAPVATTPAEPPAPLPVPNTAPAALTQTQDPAPPALPQPDAAGEYTPEQVDTLRTIFRTEIGRHPSPKTKPETMVIQIEDMRKEKL